MSKGFNWYHFSSPQTFYPLAGKMIPWFWALVAVFGVAGLVVGFLIAPTDAQQGEGYRIIFLHVPASWMSMFLYLVGFLGCARALFNFRLSAMMAQHRLDNRRVVRVPFLVDRRLVGKPMRGAW